MYLANKYTSWYNTIIFNAQSNPMTGKGERHHIIPKSLGGSNLNENLVKLTPRAHFVCHWLLTKMTEGKDKSKMHLALLKMCVSSKTHDRYKISARRYERIRQDAGKNNSGINSPTYGRKRPPEEQARINAIKAANRLARGADNYKHSDATKLAIGAKNKGNSPSASVRAAWSNIRKGRPGQDNNTGKHWYNDGARSYLSLDCPTGCTPGRIT